METIEGKIRAISISKERGTCKYNVPTAELKVGFGVECDAHGGNWHRQVSLLAVESIDKMVEKGAKVSPGDFAENITTEGLDLAKLRIGDEMEIGDKIKVRVTQIGKECHIRCAVYKKVGKCIMLREGIFTEVLQGGKVKVGDEIRIA